MRGYYMIRDAAIMLKNLLCYSSMRQTMPNYAHYISQEWTHMLGSILLGSIATFPQHCRLPTGGEFVLVWRFQEISAAV